MVPARWVRRSATCLAALGIGMFALAAPAGTQAAEKKDDAAKAQAAKDEAAKKMPASWATMPPSFEAQAETLVFPLRVKSVEGAKDLTWSIGPLWGPEGKAATPACVAPAESAASANRTLSQLGCGGAAFDLRKGQVMEIALQAPGLQRLGNYGALVVLTHAGISESKLITIKRVSRDAPVKTFGSDPRGDGSVWFTLLADPAAGALKITGQALLSLTRSDKSETSGSDNAVELLDETGKALPGGHVLTAGVPVRLVARVKGLKPGQYRGTLGIRFEDAGKLVVVVINQLSSRWSCLIALLIIAAGAVASHFIREWGTKRRPALVRQRDLVSLRLMLTDARTSGSTLDHDEAAVADALSGQIEGLERATEFEAPPDFDAQRELLKAKIELLPVWVAARHRVLALQPVSLRQPFLDRLARGRQWLVQAQAAADPALVTEVEGIDAAISEAVSNELTEQHKALQDALDAQLASGGISAAQEGRLRSRVQPLITALNESIAGNQTLALQTLEQARAEFARVMIEDLRASLAQPAPRLVEEAVWVQVRRDVDALLAEIPADAVGLTDHYRRAWRVYARSVGQQLLEETSMLQRTMEAGNQPDVQTRLEPSLQALRDKIAQVMADPDGAPADELRRLAQDLGALHAQLVEPPGAGQQMGPEAIAKDAGAFAKRGAALPAGLADTPQAVIVAPRGLMPMPPPTPWDLKNLGRRIQQGDYTITLLAGLLAVVLGLQALWIGNPGWGGLQDGLIALLWGFGLHQGAAGTFQGVAGLRRQIST